MSLEELKEKVTPLITTIIPKYDNLNLSIKQFRWLEDLILAYENQWWQAFTNKSISFLETVASGFYDDNS